MQQIEEFSQSARVNGGYQVSLFLSQNMEKLFKFCCFFVPPSKILSLDMTMMLELSCDLEYVICFKNWESCIIKSIQEIQLHKKDLCFCFITNV